MQYIYIYIFDRLSSLFQEANFVLSCCPLQNGRNEIVINTVKASTSKVRDFLFFKFIQFLCVNVCFNNDVFSLSYIK